MKELKIIYLYFSYSLQQTLFNLPIFFFFLLSKLIRYGMFFIFLFYLVGGVNNIGGYTREQMLIFYLVFNLIDTASQLLFRETYRFRPLLVSGNFDFVLTKPTNPLIRVLLGGPDFIDFGMLLMLLSILIYFVGRLPDINFLQIILFIGLFLNSLLIATAFHISVLAIGILTLNVDHLIMIYRDLTALARIPVDLFIEPMRWIITFIVPIGIMFTFPAKVLFGILDWKLVVVSFAIGLITILLSIKFWNYSLKHYQSASS